MLFTDIFMIFVDIKRPQNAKLCNSHRQGVLSVLVLDHPGSDIIKMTEFAQLNVVAMICRNAWDSKNNMDLT